MSFKLYAPGERKGNKDFLARIVVDGKRYEKVLTSCTTKSAAHQRAMELELELQAQTAPDAQEDVTFRQAAYLYAKWRKIDLDASPFIYAENERVELRRINRLIGVLGDKSVKAIKIADFVDAAEVLHPNAKPQTQNRQVMRPAASVMHYASKNGYCAWLRVKLFDEPKPVTRSVTGTTEAQLMDAPLDAMQRLLITWLFLQGTRITQTLNVTWDHIDLQRQVYTIYNKKAHQEEEKPITAEVFELLCMIPEIERHGKLWPWTHRTSVHWWLRPLTKTLGVKFTCHMARHTLGKKLSDAGFSLRVIMDTLGHMDAKSSIRYQSTDIKGVREALAAASKRAKAS